MRDCVCRIACVGLRACRRDCRSCRIVWLAGLPTRIARRGIAGLQAVGCQDCLRVGLPTGGIAYGWDCRMRDCLPHAGLPAMGLLLAGCPCRIACVGLRVCRRL